jgi:hypothetical protein
MREGGSCASARPLGENSRPDSNIDAVRASVSDLKLTIKDTLGKSRSLTLARTALSTESKTLTLACSATPVFRR